MVRLREIPRTAAFAWSPGAGSPWVATGTKSGAVDVDFSSEKCLELWELGFDSSPGQGDLEPKVTITTEAGFCEIVWIPPTSDYSAGIIAGGLDDGTLALWDAAKLQTGTSDALISTKKIHSGAIKCLQVNPHPQVSHFLATGGARGELFVTDLQNLDAEPIRLGSAAARADDIDCLDWNRKVPNILVTGSSGGFLTVWDLKLRKESLTINHHGRKPVSAVQWDPTLNTRLITAVPTEQDPVILVWNLRNAQAPEKILRGHESGVLSLSWCAQDSDLLLSCGKDNRTILWNPQTGEALGEYPVVTNWTFQTSWNPHNPSIFATASFDSKLLVQTLQNTNPDAAQKDQDQAVDGDDFFSKAQTQPQASSFSLPKAPKWLERPCSVQFGQFGRLVTVRKSKEKDSRESTIRIAQIQADSDIGTATSTFEDAMTRGNLEELCTSRAKAAHSEGEKSDWDVMKTLLASKPREELTKYLGFDSSAAVDAADSFSKLNIEDEQAVDVEPETPKTNGVSRKHKRFESIFATDADSDFLSQLAVKKGTTTNSPFEIFTGSETEADKQITKLIMLGKFEKAMDICLAEERMADAFMLGVCGGDSCIKRVQEAYFARQSGGPNYLRLLASVIGKNLWDTVHNADLTNWREVMATLCTFADAKEFPDLCEALGDRLDEQASFSVEGRKDAAFCYLAGSKLEKVVSIWISDLQQREENGSKSVAEASAFSLHAKALQDLIEKVTIFRSVVNFQDDELTKPEDWKLRDLYTQYLEYAEIVSAHGQLDAAQKYLDLLPASFPEADVARARIQQATKKTPAAVPQQVAPQQTVPSIMAAATPAATLQQSRLQQKPLPQPNGSYQPPTQSFTQVMSPASGAFAPQPQNQFMQQSQPPSAPQMSSYAPPAPAYQQPQSSNPYAPQGGYQAPQQMRAVPPPPPQQFGMQQQNNFGPPRQFNSSPAIPPPSQAKNMVQWNDIPDGFGKAPTPRRGTPAQPPLQPQPNQFFAGQSPPPSAGAPYGQRPPPKAIPPPPKSGELPQRVQSPQSSGPNIIRPSSTAQNAYAPISQPASAPLAPPVQPPIARGASPFAAPPSTAPPPNRYAPAPGSISSPVQQQQPQRNIAPPPQQSQYQSQRVASNPYAPGPPQSQPQNNAYAPQAVSSSQGPPPMSGVPPNSSLPRLPQQNVPRPDTAGSSGSGGPGPAQPTPAIRKHPKGDRSHIPSSAQPIYQILSAEFARVEARAPATYRPQVNDTRKRLDILYDHLNNEELLSQGTIDQLVELSRAVENKDYVRASELQVAVQVEKVDECGQWMVGVKRLVGMGKAITQ